jgi:hypothetical protein
VRAECPQITPTAGHVSLLAVLAQQLVSDEACVDVLQGTAPAEPADGPRKPRSSLSLRARSSSGEGSLIVTTSSSSVGVFDIVFP